MDSIQQAAFMGRIRLSYDPPTKLAGIDLDDENLDLKLDADKTIGMGLKKLAVTYNVLHDWKAIDAAVLESDLQLARRVLKGM